MVVFIVDSDLHFTKSIKSYKNNHVEKITKLCQQRSIDAVICSGDLTNNGWNGKNLLWWNYGGLYDQLTPLREQYVDPISRYTGVYLCKVNNYTFDAKSIKYLKDKLCKDRANILFFHYNIKGAFSDWWSDREKNTFYNTIKDYDIGAIVCGHLHTAGVTEWRGIKVIQASNEKFAICEFDNFGLTVVFK